MSSSSEKYWFQDLSGTIFNLDYVVKVLPDNSMSYSEKINAIVRLSIYLGVILALLNTNFLYIYIPIITMLATYTLYLFRIEQLDNVIAQHSKNTNNKSGSVNHINNVPQSKLDLLTKQNMIGQKNSFTDILNIKQCTQPNINNPFMNPLLFDSRIRNNACDVIKPENQLQIEKEYNKYCIKDASDIWNHNSGRRQFYTVANTAYPNNQGSFANWLYKTPPTCKEGNGAQCVANIPSRINSNLITPGFVQ